MINERRTQPSHGWPRRNSYDSHGSGRVLSITSKRSMDQDSTTWPKVTLRFNDSHLYVSRPAPRAWMTGRRRRTVQTPARALYIFAYQAVDSSVLCSVYDGSMCREQLIQQPEQEQHWPDKFYLAP